MAEIIDQYGEVIVYSEEGHPTPFYEYNGQINANPYGALQVLLDDDDLEEVMYNGGKQCVKIAHRKHGMCRTNIWVEDEEGIQIAKNIASHTEVCLLYTSPSPRDRQKSRMPSSA